MSQGLLLVFGSSGHGAVVADAATAAGWEVIGFADEDEAKRDTTVLLARVLAVGVAEAAALCRARGCSFLVGVGDNAARARLDRELRIAGAQPATLVHPAASVSRFARLGPGTVVLAGAVVNARAEIGRAAIVNTSASVDHDCHLADYVHVSPGAHLGGTVTVGEGTHVGIGATVRNNIMIGAWSVVGAGAVVVKNVPDHVVVVGVPARAIRTAG